MNIFAFQVSEKDIEIIWYHGKGIFCFILYIL